MVNLISQPVIIATTVVCLLTAQQVVVTWMAKSTTTNKYFLWTSAINASVLEGKYQDAHEDSVWMVMMHPVTNAENYLGNQFVVLMV